MEQLDKLVNNLNNSHLMLFVSGFFVPIILYLLAATSFENLSSKLTFWKWKKASKVVGVIALIVLVNAVFLSALASDGVNLGLHSTHTKQDTMVNMPGMDGDKTRRYTVSFLQPENSQPNQDVNLTFKVFDASSGNPVQLFKLVYEKVVHLIIVDSELQYFNHIHPTQDKNAFAITTQFPKPGIYHLYIDFQPWGAIEQNMAFTLTVGNIEKSTLSDAVPDADKPKVFKNYEVAFTAPTLQASEMSAGKQRLKFTINDAKSKQPITTLKPYLGAFGHLVMINKDTFDYLHVHPANLKPLKPGESGGPDVEFLPMSIYSPVKPGTYRVFAQFNPDGKLFTADFTVEVK